MKKKHAFNTVRKFFYKINLDLLTLRQLSTTFLRMPMRVVSLPFLLHECSSKGGARYAVFDKYRARHEYSLFE